MQVNKEVFMNRTLSLVLFLCFISACATITEDNQSQVIETQPLAAPTDEIQPFESNAAAESARNESNQLGSTAKRSLSKQEIKSLQIQLKAAGFDPGASDGVLGAKTVSALRRLQSACVNLKDILERSAGMQPAKQGGSVDRTLGPDEIRLIQVRLKDAGFDVGSIDGVMGHKTRSALGRFQSGCTAIKDVPASFENAVQKVEGMPMPAPGLEKQSQPALFRPLPATESVKDEASKVSVAADKVPGRAEARLLQEQLKAAGFDPGPLDGVLGPKTKFALQQYRSVNGPATSRKLSSSIGLKSDY